MIESEKVGEIELQIESLEVRMKASINKLRKALILYCLGVIALSLSAGFSIVYFLSLYEG